MLKVGHSAFCKQYLPLIGRIALSLLFIVSGFGIITNFAGTVGYYTALGLPMASVLAVIVVMVKLGGGVSVVTGWHAREGALALAVFTVLATVIGHSNISDPMQMTQALKNVAIIGGLLYVVVKGSGPMSLGCTGMCCNNDCKNCVCSHGSCDCKKDTMPQM